MFKLSKKKKTTEAKIKSLTPDSPCIIASENFYKISPLWRFITLEEILEKIEYTNSIKEKETAFISYYISEELVNKVESMGYDVEIIPSSKIGPFFRVYW